ncbi:MAG: DUF2249 domain-containing protein [Propionibacteriaceae bacterium]|nr:DUF2249 domain-containing protein [Propionibacteriaceae bacterium]
MTDRIPLTETHAGCACGHDHGEPELDARMIPHAIRHGAIFGALASVPRGGAMILVAPHDPVPLLDQIREHAGDTIEISYLERGPEAWRLRLAVR